MLFIYEGYILELRHGATGVSVELNYVQLFWSADEDEAVKFYERVKMALTFK